ncbi:MAG: hypothetical protein NZM04_00265 [Methylacidiphilales bacterium]|nr:hypothetical protein [Candidatus Methylacidiphilales bacterium]
MSTIYGRFLQPDPIGFKAKDVNWYRYVGNSPINYTDPEGLDFGLTESTPEETCLGRGGLIGLINYIYLRFGGLGGNDKKAHCITSCEIAEDQGKECAEQWGDKKESIDSNDPEESAEDQKANKAGRDCSNHPKGCKCCCEEKGY